jgi:mannose-6-phosphate isomerase-like protein (cupin superfamily)
VSADEQPELNTITRKAFGEPDDVLPFVHGRSVIVTLGPEEVWRSELEPGWNWDEDLKPYAEGATSCPMTHREYVVEGRILYRMEDGTEIHATPGDVLFIPPGHRAWVEGEERCVLIDW